MDTSELTREPPGSPLPAPSRRSVNYSRPIGHTTDYSTELIDLLSVLRRRRMLILAFVLIITTIGTAIVLQLTPRYTAEASVILDPRKTQVVDVQAVLSGLPYDSAVVRSEMEVLKSPTLARRVAEKLHLVDVAEFNSRLQKSSLIGAMNSAFDWCLAQLQALFPANSQTEGEGIRGVVTPSDDVAAATRALQARMDVINDGRSYVLKVKVESQDRELAASLANAYVDAYLGAQFEAKYDAVVRANKWLNEHLAELKGQVEAADRAVQTFKVAHNLTQSKDGTVATQQLGELNSQLVLAGADRAQKESALRQLQDQIRSGGIAAATQVLASPLIQRLREQETELHSKEAELSARYKPAHPAIINIQAQKKELQAKIKEEIGKIVTGMAGDVAAARAKEEALRSSLGTLQKQAGEQDQSQVQLHQLEREADASRTLYQDFLARSHQVSSQQDNQQADARLVASAVIPDTPSFPRTVPLVGLIFAGSVMTGLFAAFGVERLDNGFRTSEQLENMTGVANLGLVPIARKRESPQDMVIDHPKSPYSEAIHLVRTSLHFSNVDDPPKVIMVTSSLPQEGKTSFAVSLARSIARSGAKTLLIDCDLRAPSIASTLKSDAKPGLLSLFEDGIRRDAAIKVDGKSGLHFIPVTRGASNPQDMLTSRHMRALISSLRADYDFIILDTPPVLAVSDALVLSHLADATAFLVRWAYTPRSVVLGALKTFQMNGGQLAGFVMSRVDFSRHANYGYGDPGYFYGYYGKYKEGYGRR